MASDPARPIYLCLSNPSSGLLVRFRKRMRLMMRMGVKKKKGSIVDVACASIKHKR